ncbi:hypothetical protein FN846DRAFT_910517 [Sphaerosporella brunnea]|uniref:Uncharacterized protein n=1 Tax=Sphaerosporella brunnea TaxID=1250544 RepID=A0A5J5EMW8_9PEZI|nr:hypothetical protein FN846DRAFT_910517 [Sphaerosporella brunnea]
MLVFESRTAELMDFVSAHRRVACAALEYDAISARRYRALCHAVQTQCPVNLNGRTMCWSDLSAAEQRRYVANSNDNYLGVRDAQLFLSFVKHVFTAYKAEVKRGVQRNDGGGEPAATTATLKLDNHQMAAELNEKMADGRMV